MNKNLLLLALLLILIVTPRTSYSQSHPQIDHTKIEHFITILVAESAKLKVIADDVLEISDLYSDKWEQIFMVNIAEYLDKIKTHYEYNAVILGIGSGKYVEDNDKLDFYVNLVRPMFKSANHKIGTAYEQMKVMYGLITNKSALHSIDKAKDSISSTLQLYGKFIELLTTYERQYQESRK